MSNKTTVTQEATSANTAINHLDTPYDAAVKELLAEKRILATLLKGCTEEFQDCSIDDIAKKYIEGEPQIAVVGVDKDTSNIQSATVGDKISHYSVEDNSSTEGKVTYDIRFVALAPQTGEPIRLIINIEAQQDYYPGYPIVKRGLYYGARLISAQKNVEFTNDNYQHIRKVYSIWICYDVPAYRKNTIACYETNERILFGDKKKQLEKKEHYDLISVILLGLGNPDEMEKEHVLRMLSVALSASIDKAEKKRILSEDFNIPMTETIERKVEHVCNLSYGVRQEGKIEKAIETAKKLIARGKMTLEEIAEDTGLALEKIQELAKAKPL